MSEINLESILSVTLKPLQQFPFTIKWNQIMTSASNMWMLIQFLCLVLMVETCKNILFSITAFDTGETNDIQ